MPETHGSGSRRTGLILLLGTLAALGPFAIDTYLPAFPAIAADLRVDAGQVGLSLSAYFLGICLGQIGYGPMLDRFGRRVPLLFGLSLFAVASLLCALSPRIEVLVALRFLQALGGCAGMVAGRTLVRDLFPQEAAQVFGTLMLVMGIAPVVAPSLGGLLPFLLPVGVWVFLFCQGIFMPNLSALVSMLPAQAPTTMGIGCAVAAIGGGLLVRLARSEG